MGTRKKGFTLIELLVVIAIIAILAAILFPIFVRVQDSARLSKCLNNVKQICNACQLYDDDYQGFMVQGFTNDTWGEWYMKINPYLRQAQRKGGGFDLRGSWLCGNIPKSRYLSGGQEIPSDLKRCYGYNYAYLGGDRIPNSDPPRYSSVNASSIVKATKTIRVLEIWGWHHRDAATQGWGTAYCYPPVEKASNCSPSNCWPPGWHGGKSVVGWCDGHVSTVTLAKVDSPRATALTGIMQQYTGGTRVAIPSDPKGDNRDPWFRCTNPKP